MIVQTLSNRAGQEEEELKTTYCLCSCTPNAPYPDLVEFLGIFLCPDWRQKLSWQEQWAVLSPRFPKTSRNRPPGYLSSGTEGSRSGSARMAPAPAGSQGVRNVLPGDSYGSPGFLVPCFEGHKSERVIKRQLPRQVHFVYLVKSTLSLGLKLKTTEN